MTEIETLRREQRHRTAARVAPVPTSQLVFEMPDQAVLADTIKITFAYLDRMPALSGPEKDRIDSYIRSLIPLVFAITTEEFNTASAALVLSLDDLESLDGQSDSGTVGADDSSPHHTELVLAALDGRPLTAGAKRLAGKRAAADLRKLALLKNAASGGGGVAGEKGNRDWFGRKSKAASASSSRAVSPVASNDGDSVMSDIESIATPLGESAGASTVMETASTGVATPAEGEAAEAMDIVGAGLLTSACSTTTTPELVEEVVPAVEVPAPSPFQLGDMVLPALPELILPKDDRPVVVDIRRQWNTFANSNMYYILRLFEVRRLCISLAIR